MFLLSQIKSLVHIHGTLYLFNTDLKNEGFLLTSIKATSGWSSPWQSKAKYRVLYINRSALDTWLLAKQ